MTPRLTKEGIAEALKAFYGPKDRSVTLHTGLRGRQTFEWHIRKESGGIDEAQHHPGQMIAILNYRHEVVDKSGEIWRWSVVDGKVCWQRMCACTFNGRPSRKVPTRFTEWEKSLSQ